jgi:hypothetical protein
VAVAFTVAPVFPRNIEADGRGLLKVRSKAGVRRRVSVPNPNAVRFFLACIASVALVFDVLIVVEDLLWVNTHLVHYRMTVPVNSDGSSEEHERTAAISESTDRRAPGSEASLVRAGSDRALARELRQS